MLALPTGIFEEIAGFVLRHMPWLRRERRPCDGDATHCIAQSTSARINTLDGECMERQHHIFGIKSHEIATRIAPSSCEILDVGEEASLILCFEEWLIGK